jgi:hydrogenase/urease accessory protein HupE
VRGLAAVLVLVGLLAASPADAHQQGISYTDVELSGGRARVALVLSAHDVMADADGDGQLTEEEIGQRLPRLRRLYEHAVAIDAAGRACPLALSGFALAPNEGVQFRLEGPCPDELPIRLTVRQAMLSAQGGHNLAKVRIGERVSEHVFDPGTTEVVIGEASASVGATFRRFFVLGVEHIATGYDHVLFLLALLLVGGGLRSLVAIVTAFTVAHSLTLSLAVLDVVQLPSRLVESVIALSIAWVALENIFIDQSRGRWRITFAFGLVHGFGFASILRDLHLPAQGLAVSLLAFNLGVEAGQLVVVLVAYPLAAAIQRSPQRRRLIGVASAGILVLALWWFVERAFG